MGNVHILDWPLASAALQESAATPLDGTEWAARSQAAGEQESAWMTWLWLGTWWELFGAGETLRVLADPEHPALCPLRLGRERGLRRLQFLGTSSRGHALGGGPAQAVRLAAWLAGQRDWDWFSLQGVPAAEAAAWTAGFRSHGANVRACGEWRQRFVPLAQPWAAIESEFGPGLLSSIRSRERRLQRAGSVELSLESRPEAIAALWAHCLAIEASGWKGTSGTALACHPTKAEYYRRVLERAAVRGQAEIAVLRCDGTLIAFAAHLRHAGRLHGLKTGYLDRWRRFAPGLILQLWVLRQAHAAGAEEFDFSGSDEAYKAAFTPHTRTLCDLEIFNRTLRGRVLEALKAARARWRAAVPSAPAPPSGECNTPELNPS